MVRNSTADSATNSIISYAEKQSTSFGEGHPKPESDLKSIRTKASENSLNQNLVVQQKEMRDEKVKSRKSKVKSQKSKKTLLTMGADCIKLTLMLLNVQKETEQVKKTK